MRVGALLIVVVPFLHVAATVSPALPCVPFQKDSESRLQQLRASMDSSRVSDEELRRCEERERAAVREGERFRGEDGVSSPHMCWRLSA